MILDREYFSHNPLFVARDILGSVLIHETKNGRIAGKIVETEAYYGEDDLACHASHGKTERTKTLYENGGVLYIYLNYGIFYLTNIVCDREGMPGAILLRAAEIIEGDGLVKTSLDNHRFVRSNSYLATGPGKLSVAFGLDRLHNGLDVTQQKNKIYIQKNFNKNQSIVEAKRVGVDYAKHCRDYLWRFYIKDNIYVSKIIKSQIKEEKVGERGVGT